MEVQYIPVSTVFEAHIALRSWFEIRVEWNKDYKRIRGEENSVVDVTLPSIELATKNSTPGCIIPSPSAESEFRAAVTSLLEDGKGFYTCLRNGWDMPAFYWKVIE